MNANFKIKAKRRCERDFILGLFEEEIEMLDCYTNISFILPLSIHSHSKCFFVPLG